MVTGFPSGERSLCFSFYPEVMNAVQRDLVDPFGRVIRDLRISVTDRCNFRCTYCMPEEGMQWTPRSEILTFEEIERVARIMVERYGVDGIRLTGGEPLVRARLPLLVEKLANLGVDLAMTTNGVSLPLVALFHHDRRGDEHATTSPPTVVVVCALIPSVVLIPSAS